jgi:hypothetical protein
MDITCHENWPGEQKKVEPPPVNQLSLTMGKSTPGPVPVNDRWQQGLMTLLVAFACYFSTELMKGHDKLIRHELSLTQLEQSQNAIVTELKEIRNLLQKRP